MCYDQVTYWKCTCVLSEELKECDDVLFGKECPRYVTISIWESDKCPKHEEDASTVASSESSDNMSLDGTTSDTQGERDTLVDVCQRFYTLVRETQQQLGDEGRTLVDKQMREIKKVTDGRRQLWAKIKEGKEVEGEGSEAFDESEGEPSEYDEEMAASEVASGDDDDGESDEDDAVYDAAYQRQIQRQMDEDLEGVLEDGCCITP